MQPLTFCVPPAGINDRLPLGGPRGLELLYELWSNQLQQLRRPTLVGAVEILGVRFIGTCTCYVEQCMQHDPCTCTCTLEAQRWRTA